MRLSCLIFLCLFCPIFTWAQGGVITGKVIRNDSKSGIAGASVFLSNSSFGTATNSNGNFELNGLRPGQYTLVVASIGYADYTKTILVGSEPIKLNIEMTPKSIMMREVVISNTAKADFKRNLEMFRKQFIGTDENAKNCDIVNPDVLDFTYYKTQKTLLASADEFLIVDNRSLGYRVKFLVRDFKFDAIAGIVAYSGQRLFQELPGGPGQKKKWNIARDFSYYGSEMHFLRSLYKDRLYEEGFEMHRYARYVNPMRPPEAVIQRNMDRFASLGRRDSLNHWIELENTSKYYHQMFYPEPSFVSQVLGRTDQTGIFVFTFPDCMLVQYKKRRDKTSYRDIYLPLTVSNYETSLMSFMSKDNHAFFDMNGIIVGGAPLNEGTWAKSRLSELLPVDYVPTDDVDNTLKAVLGKNVEDY